MWRALLLSLVLAGGVAGPAAARTIDVPQRASLVLVGEKRSDAAGAAVARAGDVNGDGHADIIVGAPLADPRGRPDAGSAYVVFGPLPEGRLRLGTRGFRIDAPARPESEVASFRVAAAGDVNGDGRDDVLVSTRSGLFVVFGKRDRARVDLAEIGDAGFFVLGGSPAGSGRAGDVNGDGVPDIVLFFDIENDEELGALAIRYGTPTGVVDGFTVVGAIGGADLGPEAAPAGDVNGDGFGDLLVRARGLDAVVLIRGSRNRTDVGIDPARPFPGRIIQAPQPRRSFGFSLARYGRGFVAGAPGRTLRPGHRGAAWIVPAKGEPLRLAGPRKGGPAGLAVDSAGDVLGGPAREVIVVARAKSLLFARDGRRLRTYRGTAGTGAPVAAVRNVAGDRRPDLLFGSPGEGVAYLLTRP